MKPNVILIILDTVRAQSCSLYSCKRQTTPGLNRVASEGVRFDHAIAPATWTLPSHAAMFTGEYPLSIGVHSENMVLPDNVSTLAEILGQNGYDTSVFSSNPFLTEGSGLDRGFNHKHTSKLRLKLFEDGFDPAAYIRSREHEHGILKFIELIKEVGTPPEKLFKNVLNAAYYKYRTKVSGGNKDSFDPSKDDGALESIEAFQGWVQTTENPFFACLNFMEGHTPYRHRMRFLPDSITYEDVEEVDQNRWPYLSGEVELTDRIQTILKSLYEAEIRYLDEQLQQLWSFFQESDLWKETLVVITSDHGELLGEHGVLYHDMNRLYEQLLHVPLIVKFPKNRHANTSVDSPVSLTQIYDTILSETVGTDSELQPLGPDIQPPELVKTEFIGMNQTVSEERYLKSYKDLASQSRAVYDNGTKYILYEDRSVVSYDVPITSADGTETIESIDFTQVPDHVLEFGAMDQGVHSHSEFKMDDVVKERLKELGYR